MLTLSTRAGQPVQYRSLLVIVPIVHRVLDACPGVGEVKDGPISRGPVGGATVQQAVVKEDGRACGAFDDALARILVTLVVEVCAQAELGRAVVGTDIDQRDEDGEYVARQLHLVVQVRT